MGTGTVLYGINNIFTVRTGAGDLECRIKGKTLKEAESEHNPLAPGDLVMFEIDSHNSEYGLITQRLERKNAFSRWNRKSRSPQTLAANIDGVACVTSSRNPPFRPRFIDRVFLEAEREGIPAWIIFNKTDLGGTEEAERRLEDFERMGYRVFRCSAATGEGVGAVLRHTSGSRVVYLGQSGVGKSTILNRLYPGLDLKTGEVSRKYDRGVHTTVYSVMIPMEDGTVIDTPGIREIELRGMSYAELAHLFRDFREFIPRCGMRNCRHLDEPDCAVRTAAENGGIHPDRYESYRTILSSLDEIYFNEYR